MRKLEKMGDGAKLEDLTGLGKDVPFVVAGGESRMGHTCWWAPCQLIEKSREGRWAGGEAETLSPRV